MSTIDEILCARCTGRSACARVSVRASDVHGMCVGYPRRKHSAGSLQTGCRGQQAHAPVLTRLHDEKYRSRPASCRNLRRGHGGARQTHAAQGCGVGMAAEAKAGAPAGCERLQGQHSRELRSRELHAHVVVAHESHVLRDVEKCAFGGGAPRPSAAASRQQHWPSRSYSALECQCSSACRCVEGAGVFALGTTTRPSRTARWRRSGLSGPGWRAPAGSARMLASSAANVGPVKP